MRYLLWYADNDSCFESIRCFSGRLSLFYYVQFYGELIYIFRVEFYPFLGHIIGLVSKCYMPLLATLVVDSGYFSCSESVRITERPP